METKNPNNNPKDDFVSSVLTHIDNVKSEVGERNKYIEMRDGFIYGDLLEKSLNIELGHDKTTLNWLRRSVEIHRDQFMGRGFTAVSTYDSVNIQDGEDEKDQKRIKIENAARKQRAEDRRRFVDAIIRDNGGLSLFKDLAENASAVGFSVVKAWYDPKAKQYKLVPVESVENFFAIWSSDNFRDADLYGFVDQISETTARELYKISGDINNKSVLGQPNLALSVPGSTTDAVTNQEVLDRLEITGKVPGWKSDKGVLKRCERGKENNINVIIVDKRVVRVIDDEKKLPRYYILPNKKERRRPWAKSDVTDAMINANATYIETLSDWRTVASKVNFPKFKMYGFSQAAELPKLEKRKVQGLPLAEGQDMVPLETGDANGIDFTAQLAEIEKQFVREAAISRVLFDDPSIELNSNQAMMTSMKPTTDVAEAKKTLWAPILSRMFQEALNTVAEHEDTVKNLLDADEDWHFEIKWPSTMQREDPVFQQMLINRFNSNTISLQTFLEEQGETKEEIDRIRDEMADPLTAAVLSRSLPILAQNVIAPPGPPTPDVKVNLRGDLTPYQEANLASQQGFNDGPFPPTAGPQGNQGLIAQENMDNAEFLTGDAFQGGTPIQRGPDGQPVGQAAPPQVTATQAQNQEGQQPISQPGSGATPVSPQGAVDQQAQQSGA